MYVMKSVFQIVSDERTLGKQHKKLKSSLKDRLQRKKKFYVDVSENSMLFLVCIIRIMKFLWSNIKREQRL